VRVLDQVAVALLAAGERSVGGVQLAEQPAEAPDGRAEDVQPFEQQGEERQAEARQFQQPQPPEMRGDRAQVAHHEAVLRRRQSRVGGENFIHDSFGPRPALRFARRPGGLPGQGEQFARPARQRLVVRLDGPRRRQNFSGLPPAQPSPQAFAFQFGMHPVPLFQLAPQILRHLPPSGRPCRVADGERELAQPLTQDAGAREEPRFGPHAFLLPQRVLDERLPAQREQRDGSEGQNIKSAEPTKRRVIGVH
jgi:hypothetical protein